MMPGGEEKLSHRHDSDHHRAGRVAGATASSSMSRGGPPPPPIQEPIPRHAAPPPPPPPPPRHSWPQTGGGHPRNGGALYYHPPAMNGSHPLPRYHRESSTSMMHSHGPPVRHHSADTAGYPPHQMMHSPPRGGNYYAPPHPVPSQQQPGSYYGHPSHHHHEQAPPPPPHQMIHPPTNYYPYGAGHPLPPLPQYHHQMEYPRGGEHTIAGYHQMPYNHHHHPVHPGDHRMQQQQQQQPPGHYSDPSYMQSSMDSNYMYSTSEAQRPPSFALSSSFSVDSRSTLGHADPAVPSQAASSESRTNRLSSYPSHIALRSIADDNSKTPSPPPIPPPPYRHEPHEISAPSSLDETEGGGPLRQSGINNRAAAAAAVDRHQHYAGEASIPAEMGSSEKKETLDTASVLLAFSSTKKRPASTTSTLDDTDALSLATMSTIPHSIAPPDHGHSVTFCPPTDYPKRLAMPEDKDRLNQLHCFMRSELLEVVVIQPADAGSKETDSFSKTPTSTDPQQIGRVGLRCVHCSMSADGGRTGPSMSIFYPKSTGEIYRLVTSWKRCHLSKCKNIPKSVREELSRLNEVKARGKTSYWTESASQLGLVNMPTKIGGICFSPEPTQRCDSLTPAKFTATLMPSGQTTVTADSHSPESLPTISDTSTLVSSKMAKEALIKKEMQRQHYPHHHNNSEL